MNPSFTIFFYDAVPFSTIFFFIKKKSDECFEGIMFSIHYFFRLLLGPKIYAMKYFGKDILLIWYFFCNFLIRDFAQSIYDWLTNTVLIGSR